MDFPEIASDPAQRRLWLIWKAAQDLPLDQALVVCSAAEQFINGGEPSSTCGTRATSAIALKTSTAEPMKTPTVPDIGHASPAPRVPASITPEMREAIIKRLAMGEKNKQIAHDYPTLNPRQIQGIRMGAARRVKELRVSNEASAEKTEAEAETPESIEATIRYLRQQDNVVVRDGEQYIINGRFKVTPAELVERANKMRSRNGAVPLSVSP